MRGERVAPGKADMDTDTPAGHTVEEALKRFELIGGAGSENESKACAMTLLSWIYGEPWTDHPECAHRFIADLVILANDHVDTTPEMRKELVIAGTTGVLDTWWIPGVVIADVQRRDTADEDLSAYQKAMRTLGRVTEWKINRPRVDLGGADLRGANLHGANLGGVDLRGADLRGADLRYADLRDANLGDANLGDANLRGAKRSAGTVWPSGFDHVAAGVVVAAG